MGFFYIIRDKKGKRMKKNLIIILFIIFNKILFSQDSTNENQTYEYLEKAKIKSEIQEIEITVRSIDISQFPHIKLIIEAYNSLGEPIDKLNPESFKVYENGEPKEILEIIKLPVPKKTDVDFIFLIDITGSMQKKINQVRDNITEFTKNMMKRGIVYRIGLVLFSDLIEHKLQPTKNVDDFLLWLDKVKASGGYDEKENALEALETAVLDIDFRENAQKVLVLITDAPFHQEGEESEYGKTNHNTESIIKVMQKNQARLFSIVPQKLKQYKKMSELTTGNSFDIDYPFSKILNNFSNQFTNIFSVKYSSEKESVPDSIQISFFSGENKRLVKKTIPIVELGRKLIIENLLFKLNEAVLPAKVKELDILAEFMMRKENIGIMVEGHTDSWGSDAYNLKLSDRRAKSVKRYLVNKGIDENRIETKGYGESKPIATNETEFGRKLNRRTEIIILAK